MARGFRDRQISILFVLLGLALAALYAEHGLLGPIADARDPQDEVRYWEEHVSRNDAYAASRLRLGLAYQRVGRTDDARREFETALALDPDWEGAAISLYGVLIEQGQREQALAGLERFTSDHSKCSPCWQNLAAEYLRLRRLDDAKEAAEALLDSRLIDASGMYDVSDFKLEAYVMAGRVFAARGEHERALELFERALRREPEEVRCHLLEARSLLALGRFEASLEALARAEGLVAPDEIRTLKRIDRLRQRARQGNRSARAEAS